MGSILATDLFREYIWVKLTYGKWLGTISRQRELKQRLSRLVYNAYTFLGQLHATFNWVLELFSIKPVLLIISILKLYYFHTKDNWRRVFSVCNHFVQRVCLPSRSCPTCLVASLASDALCQHGRQIKVLKVIKLWQKRRLLEVINVTNRTSSAPVLMWRVWQRCETRVFSPGAPVSFHRESWKGGLG